MEGEIVGESLASSWESGPYARERKAQDRRLAEKNPHLEVGKNWNCAGETADERKDVEGRGRTEGRGGMGIDGRKDLEGETNGRTHGRADGRKGVE